MPASPLHPLREAILAQACPNDNASDLLTAPSAAAGEVLRRGVGGGRTRAPLLLTGAEDADAGAPARARARERRRTDRRPAPPSPDLVDGAVGARAGQRVTARGPATHLCSGLVQRELV